MFQTTITNPNTNRINKVYAWTVAPKTFWNDLKTGELTPKQLSWKLLNDDQSIQVMDDSQYGDSACQNFALSVFENALDWSLGLAIVRYCNAMVSQRKTLPKPFTVMVTRKGDVFIKTFSGKILAI